MTKVRSESSRQNGHVTTIERIHAVYNLQTTWTISTLHCKYTEHDIMTSYIRNPTQSIDAYLLEEHSCLISPRSDLKRRSFFGEVAQQEQEHEQQEQQDSLSSRMKSVSVTLLKTV